MTSPIFLPEECSEQWELIMLLISSEEKKIDRISECEIETMEYFLNNNGIQRILKQWMCQMKDAYAKKISEFDTALKCDEVSLRWRQKGNEKYRAKMFNEAYLCYYKSVLYAKQDGPMYPLALANRAAALLKLKRHQECLDDVAIAISQCYPLEQMHKLLMRRADCLMVLGSKAETQAALDAVVQCTSSVPSDYAHEYKKNILILKQKLESKEDHSVPASVSESSSKNGNKRWYLPECYKGQNEDFVAASNVLELQRSEVAGRHVVVKEDTKRGDVMFSEEPYAWVSLPSEHEVVCHGCCRGKVNAIPCPDCSRTVYCTEKCRLYAVAIHRWECVGAKIRLFSTVGIAHLALRVLLVTAYNGFPRVPEECEIPTTAAELLKGYGKMDNIEIYHKDTPPFYRMYNLVTNFDKSNNGDYIQYALTAIQLILYLETYTTFFDYLPSRIPYELSAKELRLFSATLLLHTIGQLVCNGHATMSLCTLNEEPSFKHTTSEKEYRRATAIYPSAAMMNHSCDPNIVNIFHNKRLIVRCSRELSAGAELVNCYGPHRAREPTLHRRKLLKEQYFFNCKCSACTNNEMGNFILLFTAYSCQTCKGPVLRSKRKPHCSQCQTDFDIEKARNLIEKADELFAQAERSTVTEERFEKAITAMRLKQQVWHRHNISLRDAADRLARIYCEVGDFGKSVELIKQNVQSLEYQFGSFSIEVAHELRKLSDVMLERILGATSTMEYKDWCVEAHKVIKKAVQLMDLNYGSWTLLVKRLRAQEEFIAAIVAENQEHDSVESVQRDLQRLLKI